MALKIRIFILVLAVFLTVFSLATCSNSNPNGAIHAKVTENGFNSALASFSRIIYREILRLSLPDVTGRAERVNYSLRNNRLLRMDPGPSGITPTNSGLRLRFSLNLLKLESDWWYHLSAGFLRFGHDGHVTAWFHGLRLDVNLRPTSSGGKLDPLPPSVMTADCVSIGGIDIKIGGTVIDWLYNILADVFKRDLENLLRPKICAMIGRELHQWTNEIFPKMKTSVDFDILDQKFRADYGLLDPVYYNGFTKLRFRGEVQPEHDTVANFPFSSPELNLPFGRTKHIYLVISDFVANSLLHSAHLKGIGRQTYSVGDILDFANIREFLEDKLCKGRPNCTVGNLYFTFNTFEAPTMSFSDARGLALRIGNASVVIGGGDIEMFRLHVNATITALPTLSSDARRLMFKFSSPLVRVEVIRPTVQPEQEQQFQNLVRAAASRWGLVALNKFGKRGVEIPNIEGGLIEIANTELKMENRELVLGANLVFNV